MRNNIILRFFAFIFFCHVYTSNAQHLVGAEISYSHVSGNTFEITLSVYKDCASSIEIANSQTISYSSVSLNIAPSVVNLVYASGGVIKTCDRGISVCDGGTIKSFQSKTFKGKVNLTTPATDYKFQWLGFNRTNQLNTFSAPQKGLFVEAMINTIDAPTNSSPVFLSNPSFYVFQNSLVEYNPQCIDATNNDKVEFSLVTPMSNAGANLGFTSGFSATQPMSSSSPFTINSLSGVINFTPSVVAQVGAIAIKATEKRGSTTIGYTMRDMQIEVLPSIVLPTLLGFNGNDFEKSVCVGDLVSVLFTGLGANSSFLKMTLETALPGASFSSNVNFQSVFGSFSYSPKTAGDHIFVLKLSDNNCPIQGITQKTYTIKALAAPKITLNVPSVTILTVCNTTLNIPVTSNVTGNAPFTYQWFKSGEPVLSTASTYTITTIGQYFLSVKDNLGCNTTNIVSYKAKLESDFATDIYTACETKPTTFTNKSSLLDLNTRISNYTWDFGDGSPTITTTSSLPLTHTFNNRGKYAVKLTAFSDDGCVVSKSDSVRVYFSPASQIYFSPNGLFKCEKPGIFLPLVSVVGVEPSDFPKISYEWTFTGISNTSSEKVIDIRKGPSPGYDAIYKTIDIKLEASFVGCAFSSQTTVNPNPKPGFTNVTKNFTPTCTFVGYPNFELQALATISGPAAAVSNILKYEWISFDGVFTSVGVLPIKIKNKERKYDLTVTDALGCLNDTTITIEDGLKPNFKFNPYYCDPSSIVVAQDDSKYRGTILNRYIWDLGNGTTIGGTNQAVKSPLTIPNAGFAPNETYFIKLILEDLYSCLDTVVVPMMRYNIVNTFEVPKTKLCFNEPMDVKSIKSFSKIFEKNQINFWNWDFGNGIKDTLVNHRTYTINGFSSNIVEKTFGTQIKVYGDTAFNRTISYQKPGVFTITHTVGYNNGRFLTEPISKKDIDVPYGCLATFSQVVTVSSDISYKIDTTQSNYCAGVVTTLTSAKLVPSVNIPIIDYVWKIGKKNELISTFPGITNQRNKVAYTLFENGNINYTNDPFYAVLNVKDADGCIGKDSILIENMKISDAVITNPPLSCQNQLLNFNITPTNSSNAASIENTKWYIEGTDSIYYKNASKTPKFLFNSSPINVHNYSVSFTGSGKFKDCMSTFSGIYTTTKAPKTDFTVPSNWCNPDELTINPTLFSFTNTPVENLRNSWNFSDSTLGKNVEHTKPFNLKFNANSFNKIMVITTDPNTNCTHTATGLVRVYQRPKADFTFASTDPKDAPYVYSTSIINFKDITLIDTSRRVKRTWDFGNGTAYTKPYNQAPLDTQLTYNQSKIFFTKLLVKNTELCKDSVMKKIDLTSFLKMPNAFNPNDDQEINRTFGVIQNGIRKLDYFKIYNRWGQLVFESTDTKTPWNGKINNSGADAPTGVYMYTVKASTGYNEVQEYKGQVLLAR